MFGEEERQKGGPLCKANPAHGPKKPSYICLDTNCKHKRLLCYLCLGDQNHLGHKIALINPNVEPFSRLCSNCHLPNAKQMHSSLSKKATSIAKAISQVEVQITTIFESIRSKILNPITTLCDTYSREMANLAVHTLQSDQSNEQQIQKIAAKINYLLTVNDTTFNASMTKIQLIEQNAVKIINETSQKIELALGALRKDIALLETTTPVREIEKNQPLLDKLLTKSPEHTRHPHLQLENIRNILDASLKQEELMLSQQKQGQKNTRSRDRKRPSRPEVKKDEGDVLEKRKPGRKPGFRPRKRQQGEGEGSSFKHEQHHEPEYAANQSIAYPEYQSRHSNQESVQSQHQEDYWITETLSANKPISQLSHADYKKIRSLYIQCLVSEPKDLFQLLPKLKNLSEIHIFDSTVCEENKIIELMSALPTFIRKIYFNCSNQFNRNCISVLYKKQLRKITRIQYFYDIQNLLRRVDESLYFREKEKGVRVQPMDYSDTHYMTTCFPDLKNVWIRIKNYRHNRRHNRIKFDLLESITLGQLEEEEDLEQKAQLLALPTKILEYLLQTAQLKCLVLLSLHIEIEAFRKVIANNQNLETLYLEQCIGPTEAVMKEITKQSKLKNFSFKECPEITGSFIQQVPAAEIFILDHVWTSNPEKISSPPVSPFTSFSQCNSLVYFNIYGNPFFNDVLFASLNNSFATIRSMNIGFTCITDACVQLFKYIPNIECLCLDENLLSAQGIYDICSCLPKIQKLSLCGFNGQKNKGQISSQLLNQIGKILPNLRHLSLRNCCRLGQDFQVKQLPNLKTVQLDKRVGQHFISTLKCAGIKFYDDSDLSEI